MKKILVTIFVLSTANTQKLDEIDALKQNLEMVLELASRSEQKVFVDDFTGLNFDHTVLQRVSLSQKC